MITLENILKNNQAGSGIILGENAHPSISVPSDLFYVPSTFDTIKENGDSRFVIVSAPGASGKTALAMYIAERFKGIYWNLADIQIGENTFHGTLWKAMKQDRLFGYWNELKEGRSVLVLDAFDEAEMISGRSGIDFFLNDVEETTRGGSCGTVFLFSRTETAKYLEEYCLKADVSYSMYEIRFFDISAAKSFVKKKLDHNGLKVTGAIEELIDSQFDVIMEALDQTDEPESFLGYAPVLEALTAMIQSKRNTALLLREIQQEGSASINIIYSILKDLLDREHKKFVKALKEKWESRKSDFSRWDELYTPTEQLVRILEKTIFEETQEESLYDISGILPEDLYDDYNKTAVSFIPQHPFIQNLSRTEGLEFAGPAFRDYTYAAVLNSDYDEIVKELLYGGPGRSYSPSQLLYDFYLRLSDGSISSDIYQIIYDSFKSKEGIHREARAELSRNDLVSSARFTIFESSSGKITEDELEFTGKGDQITLERISDSVLNIDGTLQVGTPGRTARIQNSFIFARRIVFGAEKIMLNADHGKKCVLISEEPVMSASSGMPAFEIRTDSPDSLQISFPNISAFFRLKQYYFESDSGTEQDYMSFYVFFQKLLGFVNKHKRTIETKDKGFIDNQIIGQNAFRRDVMDYFIEIGIILKNKNNARWYELDAEKLAQFGVSQVMFDQQEENIKALYKDFRSRKY